jgi:2-dehydropantoate 2-reductase
VTCHKPANEFGRTIDNAVIKKIGVIGVGGVGGFFGGKLCDLLKSRSDLSISFIARGAHLRAIQENGLLLRTEHDGDIVCRPTSVSDDLKSLPELDLCLLCVKEFDLNSVLAQLAPKIGGNTVILPLLNGVDIHARVRSVITTGIVLPACVYVGTHIESPGTVAQRGGACKILFGPDPSNPGWPPTDLQKLFGEARIKSEWTENVQAEIWKKFIFICSYGLVSAAHAKTVGQILDDPVLKRELESLIAEVISIATAAGIELPPNVGAESMEKGRSFPYETKTSFQRDFERADKRDERDLYAGAMLRMGARFGIDVPTTRRLSERLNALKPSPP